MQILQEHGRYLNLEYLGASLRRRLGGLRDAGGEIEAETEAEVAAELRAVEHALARLNRGEGEQCEACGRPLEPARLRLLPQLTRCSGCG